MLSTRMMIGFTEQDDEDGNKFKLIHKGQI